MPQPKIKLTMAFDADVHAAMTALAHDRRRSFTAETQVAMDEHLERAGISVASNSDKEEVYHGEE